MDFRHTVVLPGTAEKTQTGQGTIFFIGNATILLRYAGFTILTDPNFLHRGDHVHLGYGMKATRLHNPAIDLAELPPLDMVLLSHLHEDHFDRGVARDLDKGTPITTTPKAADALRKKMHFYRLYPLDTWQTLTLEKGEQRLNITAMPGKHGPGPLNPLLPPVMGSMLEFEVPGHKALRMYITGDTLMHKRLREIPKRYHDIDIALLHLGGTRLLKVMLTMDAGQGVKMIELVKPRTAIPVHYNDYSVFTSSLSDFQAEVEKAGLANRVHYLKRGDTYTFEAPAVTDAGR
ncbi:MBL fold metallo-hydrolase [Dictyobacter aurantiacus]|uniref:Metallo-beta-lactamase domain-containing protein n=1 Tax=Dictyobacter aurantiacus TaxID=1936993 RepID=A0A401ZCR6_9CHLR|nr:MBL fold metallo-hydrolase [Dictyobacter aurantiacus]GCE04691.1 hypothetical protein KDAU_20200 [Dictyobacter aurantiacus]